MLIAGIEVEMIRKDIKNLHLAVYPPEGRVRLAAPRDVNEKTLELFVISRLSWIRKQQRKFERQDRQSPRKYLDRETHYFLGRGYLLKTMTGEHHPGQARVRIVRKKYIEAYLNEGEPQEAAGALLENWYRKELKIILAELVPKWEKILGVRTNKVRVRGMKTKWGSCNPETGNILINLEMAKKPMECIEYVVAHELVHLLERKHNDQFRAYLDKYLPNWSSLRSQLNEMKI